MNICYEQLGGMCALTYENWLGIKCDNFVYLFCPNTGMKFREPNHPNHMIPHRVYIAEGCSRNSSMGGCEGTFLLMITMQI